MKVVKKNKPIPVEETITIELTKTELAILTVDVGATNGWSAAEEYRRRTFDLRHPVIELDSFPSTHSELYAELIWALEEW